MSDPRLTALAAALPDTVPFVGPEAQERASGTPVRARLGANENGFGPSPDALRAMAGAASDAWMYPDPENHDLRQALARHHDIAPDRIVVGAGIDGLLGSITRLCVAPGDAVVTSRGAYPTFAYHVAGFGGVLHEVPYKDDAEDPDALIATAVEVGAKLIYLSNPDNPMGSWYAPDVIAGMIERVPDGALLLLDEAYAECADTPTAPPMAPDDPRVLRLRTFSKAYGLAGARIGYAIGSRALISAFGKVRNHFGVSRISQAGALAALQDGAHLETTRQDIAASVRHIGEIARASNLVPLPSAANFVAVDCGRDGAFARAVMGALLERGIFVRMPGPAPLDRCIRISCGPEADMKTLAAALPDALEAARAKLR